MTETEALQAMRDLVDRLDRDHAMHVMHPSTDVARQVRAILDAVPAPAPHDGLGPEMWPPRVAPVTCEVPRCSNVATSHGAADLCIEHAAEFAAWRAEKIGDRP